ncbi:MAG: hypothetical protein CM15mV40_190 [Caudoviricetes sp.]|nr:MAG: hypothetical protein CM15mV40_190 [Caudoviricetes sp.]
MNLSTKRLKKIVGLGLLIHGISLNSLASRLKARSFHCCWSQSNAIGVILKGKKLTSDGPWLGIDEYFGEIGELSKNALDRPNTSDHLILEDLIKHGRKLLRDIKLIWIRLSHGCADNHFY